MKKVEYRLNKMINEKYIDYLRMFLVDDENDFIVQNFYMLYILLSYIKIEYDRQNIVFDNKQIDKLGKKLKIYNISNSFEFVNNFIKHLILMFNWKI